jgi:transcriptional regulator with XRE-family HTH domain
MKGVYTEVGRVLFETRMQKELSRKRVALRAGVLVQHIYNIERGVRPLPPYQIEQFARGLGIEPQMIVDAIVQDFRNKLESKMQTVLPKGDAA